MNIPEAKPCGVYVQLPKADRNLRRYFIKKAINEMYVAFIKSAVRRYDEGIAFKNI